MKKIAAYVTSDGKIFTSADRAKRHAEDRYGAEITTIAREITSIDKYINAVKYLESNLEKMTVILALKQDLNIEEEEDEND